jgi:hypothetical protein
MGTGRWFSTQAATNRLKREIAAKFLVLNDFAAGTGLRLWK